MSVPGDERGAISFIEASYLLPLITAAIAIMLIFQLMLLRLAMDEAKAHAEAMALREAGEGTLVTETGQSLDASSIEKWIEQSISTEADIRTMPVQLGRFAIDGMVKPRRLRLDNGYDDINLWRLEAVRRLRER